MTNLTLYSCISHWVFQKKNTVFFYFFKILATQTSIRAFIIYKLFFSMRYLQLSALSLLLPMGLELIDGSP